LIGGKEYAIAVPSTVRVIRHHAQAEEIRRGIKSQGVFGIEALTLAHFVRNRAKPEISEACQVDPAGHRISLKCRG
jgi:hypothetical protein